MRVGLIIYESLKTLSGGYLYDRKLIEYLKNRGDQVEIISLKARNYLSHLTDNVSRQLCERIFQADLDIFLQDELNHPSLFWINQILKMRGYQPAIIAIVHHLRSSENHPRLLLPIYRRIERHYLKTLDGFIFNSRATQQDVEKLTGRPANAVVAHPGGDRFISQITEMEIEQRAFQPGPIKLLFVGNLIPRKGLHHLLDSLSLLPPETWRLTIVGRVVGHKSYTVKIRRAVKAKIKTRQISMLGSVDTLQLAEQYRLNHLLVVPSSYEGFGIVYLEAMGFGLPAIATDSGATAETIINNMNGFLVQPNAREELAQRIHQLHLNRDILSQMGMAARGHFLAAPTWEDTGTRIYDFLQKIVGKDERTGGI